MDPIGIRILNGMQSGFPVCQRPFALVAPALELTEETLIQGVSTLLQEGFLTRFGPFFNAERFGGGLTLAAMSVPPENFSAVANLVNAQPEIAHNYARDHLLNMWFVVATEERGEIEPTLRRIEALTGHAVVNLPKMEEYRLGFQVRLHADGWIDTEPLPETNTMPANKSPAPDPIDRAIIAATQAGLPLQPESYRIVADSLDLPHDSLLTRMNAMLRHGWIRRIGAAPNHYKLGLKGNGMSVWHVPDEKVTELGRKIGALDCVTHCYRRPRNPPAWPYNLFVMVHGPDRAVVDKKVAMIANILGADNLGHEVLHSADILKKTGLRFKS